MYQVVMKYSGKNKSNKFCEAPVIIRREYKTKKWYHRGSLHKLETVHPMRNQTFKRKDSIYSPHCQERFLKITESLLSFLTLAINADRAGIKIEQGLSYIQHFNTNLFDSINRSATASSVDGGVGIVETQGNPKHQ